MKRSTVEEIVHYLFNGLPPPFEILGHDSCRKIEISRGKYLKVIGGSKEIFLKNLSEDFIRSIYLDGDNTILINDDREKCVCNDSKNRLFLETWTLLAFIDDFFLLILTPWLLRLHIDYTRGQLRDFVNRNWIRILPLATNNQVLLHIVNGMALFSGKVYKKYEILGVPGFEIPKIK